MIYKRNKKQSLIIALAIVGVLIIISFINISIENKNKYNFSDGGHMFNSLSDLDFLEEYKTHKKVTDKKATNKGEGCCFEIKYNDNAYQIYGYVFQNKEEAWEYANKLTSTNFKSIHELTGKSDFVSLKSVSFAGINPKRTTVVVSDSNVLVIKGQGSSKKYAEFTKFIMDNLPRELDIPEGL